MTTPLPTDTVRTIPASDSYPGLVEITRNGRSIQAVGSYDAAIEVLLAALDDVEGVG